MFKTIFDVKRLNIESGFHFFDSEAMAFFDSRIESPLLSGRYFITSERFDAHHARLFSIREAQPDGSIRTIGEFQGFASRAQATAHIERLSNA